MRGKRNAVRRFAAKFLGWDMPGHEDFLLEIPQGKPGVITVVERHAIGPWTQYTVKFDDGTCCRVVASWIS